MNGDVKLKRLVCRIVRRSGFLSRTSDFFGLVTSVATFLGARAQLYSLAPPYMNKSHPPPFPRSTDRKHTRNQHFPGQKLLSFRIHSFGNGNVMFHPLKPEKHCERKAESHDERAAADDLS